MAQPSLEEYALYIIVSRWAASGMYWTFQYDVAQLLPEVVLQVLTFHATSNQWLLDGPGRAGLLDHAILALKIGDNRPFWAETLNAQLQHLQMNGSSATPGDPEEVEAVNRALAAGDSYMVQLVVQLVIPGNMEEANAEVSIAVGQAMRAIPIGRTGCLTLQSRFCLTTPGQAMIPGAVENGGAS